MARTREPWLMESFTTSLNSVFGCLDLTSVSEDLKLRELLIVLLLPTTGFSLMQGSFCCAGLPLLRDDNEEQDDEAEDALDDSVEWDGWLLQLGTDGKVVMKK